MSEVLFNCAACSMNLCAGDSAIGSSLTCPSCHNNITLPEPDFSFNCPSCSTLHLAPAAMGNTSFQCPSCGNGFVIPLTGAKYLRPLKSKPKTMACPACSSQLEVDDGMYVAMAGQTVECPICRGGITIPMQSKKSLFRTPTKASLKIQPEIQPPAPIVFPPAVAPAQLKPGCPHCKREMPANAVICVQCGFDLRTGQKLEASVSLNVDMKEEKKESRLTFKNGRPTADQTINPSVAKHGFHPFSTWQGMIMLNTIKSTLKPVVTLLAVIAAVAAILYFVDFGKPEADSWKIAAQSLRSLKSKPADTNALQAIKSVIPKIENGVTGHTPKAGLMVVWALGQLDLGNVRKGLETCRWIEENYADTDFVRDIAASNFSNACTKCKGEIPVCQTCGGSGKIASTKLDVPRLLVPERPETERKVHRLGDNKGRSFSEEHPPILMCVNCGGTGKPRTKCEECKGTGTIFAREQVHSQYIKVVRQEYRYAVAKYIFEKFLDTGTRMQKLLHITRPVSQQIPSDQAATAMPRTGPSEETIFSPAPEEKQGVFAQNRDWNMRYKELYQICTEKFVPPKLQQHIAVRINGGNIQEGTLVSLTESNLEIRIQNVNATVGLQNTQLDTESRIRCFRDDYATFYAGKKCDAEKAEAGDAIK